MTAEPSAGQWYATIAGRRTRLDWAEFMKDSPDVKYPDARKAALVTDSLNIHAAASFYEAFSPEEAFRLAQRLEIHCNPKHGSWLNTAEIELSALAGRPAGA
jgi:hypothetical protein